MQQGGDIHDWHSLAEPPVATRDQKRFANQR